MAGQSHTIGPVKRLPPNVLSESSTTVSNISEIEKTVRECYVENRRYYSGDSESEYGKEETRWDRPSKVDGCNIWRRIAQFLIDHGIDDVHRYVHAQFVYSEKPSELYPTFLLGKKALKNYHDYNSIADDTLKSKLEAEIARFELEVAVNEPYFDSTEQCWRHILTSSSSGLSPLIRYLCAVDTKFYDIASMWRNAAATQAKMDPKGYIRVWGRYFGDIIEKFMVDAGILTPESKLKG